ncbi:hypothetical protein [Methylobacterium sp. CM6247]
MAETNDFDLFIGLILARLYEARPMRLDLEASDFLDTPDIGEDAEEGRAGNWANTMFWLKEEGYIRDKGIFSGDTSYCFVATELTEKGFRALNAIPPHLSKSSVKKSTGTRLAELAKEGGWKAGGKLAEKGAGEGANAIAEFVQSFFS